MGYRLSRSRQQDLLLNEESGAYGLKPGEGLGTAKTRDPKEEFWANYYESAFKNFR
ncbi:MAG: Restriction endonuclease subunit [Chthoniobacteraceae bacterium]|nr:Restriction endonuclease subunit [Chthoniobacteraceae bacterium]